MRFGGRIQAAIEVLEDVMGNYTPATDALRDWGKKHRFAGSKDRAAIGGLVHDSLRRKSSIAWRMGDDSARALALGTLVWAWESSIKDIQAAIEEDGHGPKPLTEAEIKHLEGAIDLQDAPDWIQADIPEWIWPSFANNFGEDAILEGQALLKRPPLDLRVNSLKSTQDKALKALSEFTAQNMSLAPYGVRIKAGTALSRLPNIQAEEIFLTGGIEIQDEGSQLVSLLVDAKPGEKILDYCAGGGGKTLALAADMQNQGELYAYDIDKRRLAPIYQRSARAGVEILDVCQPPMVSLDKLNRKMDRVVIDAPCSGSGTWRRKPDAKWRLSLDTLELRIKEQQTVLKQAKSYVRHGGLLIYITCSMFAEDNEGQVYKFLEDNSDLELLSAGEIWEDKIGIDKAKPWSEDGLTVTLTPASTDTDGFFFAVMKRK
ncbi:MAG: RsmB/NOP family class I SAM-dependent RNA methyltransferase [Robiginitomaculum sp.]|nr:RsmB/NOP family class I SAM-dependent RNA methyltransferase [Robiginitomaculum sp.]